MRRRTVLFGGGQQSVVPPLDGSLSVSPVIAYGMRKLRTAYAGKALKAFIAGPTFQDIGFLSNGNLDVPSLLSFAGANQCNMDTWYDQSGNTNNQASQFTAGNLGNLVTSGATTTQNGHVVINSSILSSGGSGQIISPPTIAQPFTVAALCAYAVATGSASVFATGSDNVGGLTNQSGYILGLPTVTNFIGVGNTSVHTQIYIANGASSQIIVDGTLQGTINPGTDNCPVGLYGGGKLGNLMEVLVFSSILSATDQTTLRANWHAYWNSP